MAYQHSELYAPDAHLHASQDTINRLVKDVSSIYKNPLNDQGIYYIHDDENMLRGYAMIIGPEDTPYQDGFYFFEFRFPYNYPQSPPRLIFKTNDGKTRFHPNLYKNGKVCLSILNTWKGEGWTSCQTIRSVLMTLVSILDDKPLLNEPGISEEHPSFEKYNKIIRFRNYEHSIMKQVGSLNLGEKFAVFKTFMDKHFEANKDMIRERIEKLASEEGEHSGILTTGIYRLNCIIDYSELLGYFDIMFDIDE